MKTFVFVAFAAISCILVHADPNPNIRSIHDECQSNPATYLDDDSLKAIRTGKSFDRVKAGAHMLCMSTKFGTQNEDGSVNREAIRRALAQDITDATKLEEITNQCSTEGATPAETAMKLGKCIRDNTRQGGHDHHDGHHHDHLHEIH